MNRRLFSRPAVVVLIAVFLFRLGVATAAFNLFEAQPFIFDPGQFGSVSSAWLNGQGLADPGTTSNFGLRLAQDSPEFNFSYAGALISNVQGLASLSELGFDFKFGSVCAREPAIIVRRTDGRDDIFRCDRGRHSSAPGGGGDWERVRFSVPRFPRGVTVTSIQIRFGLFEQGPSFALLDNIDINGTLIGRPGVQIVWATTRDGNWEIYVMEDDGTNQTRLTNNLAADACPDMSRGRTRIVFQSDRDTPPPAPPGVEEIYIMNANGTNQTRLTNSPGEDACPRFTPDGTKIVFHSRRDGGAEVYVMNVDGTGQTRLTTGGDNHSVAVSPDGTKISFFSRRTGNPEVWVMNIDGTNQKQLTFHAAEDNCPCPFSPDGSKIAFSTNRDGNFEIYVMNVDGTNPTRLTNHAAQEDRPDFTPNGKIVFTSNRDGNSEIYIMNADGTNVIRLTFSSAVDAFAVGR